MIRNKLIYLSIFVVLLFACGQESSGVVVDSFILNGETIALKSGDYMVKADDIYFSDAILAERFNVTIKEIVPDRQIGICRDDLCIPFDIGDKFDKAAIVSGDGFFIPIVKLMDNLGENSKWDKDNLALEITLLEQKGYNFEPIKK